jgi:hypothetical protein
MYHITGRNRIGIACAVVLGGAVSLLAQGANRPRGEFRGNFPNTLTEAWANASVVALVRIDSEVTLDRLRPGPIAETTVYKTKVLKVFKGGDIVERRRNVLSVARHGIRSEDPTDKRVVLDDGLPAFEVGEEYIVFLLDMYPESGPDEPYWVGWGGSGAFGIKDGYVRRVGKDPLSLRQNGREAEMLMRELSAIKEKAAK